jgi:hypothetical protein
MTSEELRHGPSRSWYRRDFLVKTTKDQAARSLSVIRCGSWVIGGRFEADPEAV